MSPALDTRPADAARSTEVDDHRRRLVESLPVSERRWTLSGISTAVLVGGSGPPLVLLHGPGESAANFVRVIPGLTAHHRVVAPDLPGHGASRVEDAKVLDRERLLLWLAALIENTCPSAPVLVGHVLGGALAARFAVDHASAIDHLVLVDALGLVPFRPAPKFALTMMAFLMRPTERSFGRFMRQCSYDLDGLRRDMGGLWSSFQAYNLELARSSKSASRVMREVGLPPIPPEDLARISVPTHLIWGRHDRANRLRIAEAASARYGWSLHVIEDCADDPPRDRPEAFLRALRSALGRR